MLSCSFFCKLNRAVQTNHMICLNSGYSWTRNILRATTDQPMSKQTYYRKMWLLLQPIHTKTEQIPSYFLSSTPCPALSQAETPNKAEHGVCCLWSGLEEVTYQQPAMCLLQCWMLNMWGPKPRAWEEVLTRVGSNGGVFCLRKSPGRLDGFRVYAPHRSSPYSPIGGSCRMHCCGSKCWTSGLSQH